MRLFFDTSALVKRYIQEGGSRAVEKLCGSARELHVSIIYPSEAVSTLCRLKRQGKITPKMYASLKSALFSDLVDANVFPITPAVIKHAIAALETYPLKALDAIHIGCALEIRPDTFISADVQQLQAAKGMGLNIKFV